MWKLLESASVDEIIPNLHLGNAKAAKDINILRERKITHILTVADEHPPPFPKDFTYKVLEVVDFYNQDLLSHFQSCLEFIHEALQNDGCILVHCAAGMSRSASITIAYLMWTEKMKFDDAFKFVKSKRGVVFPNPGFKKQLRAFEMMEYSFDLNHPSFLEWKEAEKQLK